MSRKPRSKMNPVVSGPIMNSRSTSLLKDALISPLSGTSAPLSSQLPAFCSEPSLFSEQRGFSAICALLLSQSRSQFLGRTNLLPSLLSVMRLTTNIPEICHFIRYTTSKDEQSLNSQLSFSPYLSLSKRLQINIKKATFPFFLMVSDQCH